MKGETGTTPSNPDDRPSDRSWLRDPAFGENLVLKRQNGDFQINRWLIRLSLISGWPIKPSLGPHQRLVGNRIMAKGSLKDEPEMPTEGASQGFEPIGAQKAERHKADRHTEQQSQSGGLDPAAKTRMSVNAGNGTPIEECSRGMAAEAGAGLSGVFADREAKGGRLAPGRSLQVFPLDGTLLGSDGSHKAAQHHHLKNGQRPLQGC